MQNNMADSAKAKEKKLNSKSYTHVFPTQGGFTALAINVGNCVQSCQQNSLFSRTAADVHSAEKNRQG